MCGLRTVRDQVKCFPDDATITEWSPADRSKMLRRLEYLVAEHAESLMRLLLQLDSITAEVRTLRTLRVRGLSTGRAC